MLTTLVLGGLLAAGCIGVLVGIRGHRPQGPGPNEPAPVLVPDPYVRLACHSLWCGHMTTPHMPTGDGTAICRECGSIRTEATDA